MLLEERSAAIRVPQAPSSTALVGARSRNAAAVIVVASLVVATLTLLLPSSPTYDPWAWIIWGREVAHLDLLTTDGPSWKPLPVLCTTIFSFFGPAAPYLWLVVARAGAIAALALTFRVTRRLGGGIVGGVAATAALALAPWWIRNAALGNSEGLIVAFLFGAIELHLLGRRREAFALAAAAGLLRPEAWPFFGLYGLWLLRRGELPARAVLGTGAGVLALWLLPEWWGSGDLLRAAHRAKEVNPGAPTYAEDPVVQVLRDARGMLTAPLLAGFAAAAVWLAVRRDRALAALSIMAIVWLGLVAYMTKDGFSGNQRYLIAPVALIIVLGGAGGGRVLEWAADRIHRGVARPGGARHALVAGAAVLCAVAFAGPSVRNLPPALRDVAYQSRLGQDLPELVREAGGAAALRRCGTVATGPFLVPAVAWNLHLHTQQVAYVASRPGVVFRVRTTDRTGAVPSLAGVGSVHTLAHNARWRIVATCERSRS